MNIGILLKKFILTLNTSHELPYFLKITILLGPMYFVERNRNFI